MENPLVDILGPHLKRKRKKVTKKERIWVKYNLQASVDPITVAKYTSIRFGLVMEKKNKRTKP